MGYIVTAPVAVVTVPLGKNASQVRFLEQGASLPDGIDQAQLDHLVAIGFIEPADDGQPDDGQPDDGQPDDGQPDDGQPDGRPAGRRPAGRPAKPVGEMTVEELKAYAAEHNIDLTGASKKDDILAAIQAAQGE